MPWSSCEVYGGARARPCGVSRPSRHAGSRLAALAALAVTAACVTTVTRYYVPDDHNPRFDTSSAAAALGQYLRVQCPQRAAAGNPDSGDVRITIQTDTSGAVLRAELLSSTGDEMLDGLFGTVAAQLKVDSLRATAKPVATRTLRIGYRCASDAASATLQVVRS